ncbi:hypothetical protein L484_025255 [Morus notabilis]|uniref:Uncharacterized protein n=1 Tax=Morus notabilis TaxID=981085 RepID=W9S4W0_9ROSA|nr:hypothetical protein L484_025255 [Morus notabilis]
MKKVTRVHRSSGTVSGRVVRLPALVFGLPTHLFCGLYDDRGGVRHSVWGGSKTGKSLNSHRWDAFYGAFVDGWLRSLGFFFFRVVDFLGRWWCSCCQRLVELSWRRLKVVFWTSLRASRSQLSSLTVPMRATPSPEAFDDSV